MGIIGFGGMGRYHFDSLLEEGYDKLKVKGIYDLSTSAMDAGVERGLYAYKSKEKLLNDSEIDLVLIATTNEVHKELAIEAMRAGKHVICEKPATITSEELCEIISVSEETGKIFTIDQNRRTNRDFVLMKRKVEEGLIGKPLVIESRVEGSRGMPSGWRTLKALGGGMMLDWGVHLIDQILYMIPEKVVEVYCKMLSVQYKEVDDNFHLCLTSESGLCVIIEVGTNNYITHPRWYVKGESGTLQIDSWDCEGKIVRCIDKEDKWEEEIFYTAAGPTKTMAPRNENSTQTITLSMPQDIKDSLTVVYDQFLDAVDGVSPLKITAGQALRVMKVMEAAFESVDGKKTVSVEI